MSGAHNPMADWTDKARAMWNNMHGVYRTAADDAAELTDEERARRYKTREAAEQVMSRHADSFSALASSDTPTQVKDPLPVPAASQAFVTKVTEDCRVAVTGAKRNSREGRGRFDLIAPAGLRRLAQLYERGGKAHGDRNWEQGQPLSWFVDSAFSHVIGLLEGDMVEDHAAALAWNAFGFMQTQEWIKSGRLPAELDDLPKCDDKYTESADSGAERQVERLGFNDYEPPTVGDVLSAYGYDYVKLAAAAGWGTPVAVDVITSGIAGYPTGASKEGLAGVLGRICTGTSADYWLDIQRKRDEWEARQK